MSSKESNRNKSCNVIIINTIKPFRMPKLLLFVAMFFCLTYVTSAQTADSSTDKGLKEQVLKEITERFQVNNHSLDLTVNSLNKKIDSLNQKISESKNANDKALRRARLAKRAAQAHPAGCAFAATPRRDAP